MGLTAENEGGYRLSSPVHFAANLKAPLMIMYNFGDDNVCSNNHFR
jgi:dipeptidyl aminopeptidase/acylaminoacyl peptidase